MSKTLLIEPHYFGNLSYLTLVDHFDQVLWEVSEHFVKQTYRNRTVILSANGPLILTVPVKFGNRTPFKDVRIDDSQRWHKEHWRAIESAYAKSAFFEYYAHEFEGVLLSPPRMLLDLCLKMMTICLKDLQTVRPIAFTERFEKEVNSNIADFRNLIHPKKQVVEPVWDERKKYFQNFGKEFVPDLSILDLLFLKGPEALTYLKQSTLLKSEQF